MADVIDGYPRTRSGSKHRLPAGATCDQHPDRPAVARIQGETDSFGCELCDMCAECYEEYQQYLQDNPNRDRGFDPYADIDEDY